MKTTDQACFDGAGFGALKRRQILVADGNPYFLNAVCPFLEACGHHTGRASNADDALAVAQDGKTHFDTIIVDDLLDDGAGLRLVRALREAGFQGQIVVKGEAISLEQRRAYHSLGAVAVIEAPVDLPELLELVQSPPEDTKTQ